MADMFYLSDPLATLDFSDGNGTYFIRRGTYNVSTRGQITFTVLIVGTTEDARSNAAAAYQELLTRARSAEGIGSSVTWQAQRGTASPILYDLLDGTLTPRQLQPGGLAQDYDVLMTCYPYARGVPYEVTYAGALSGSGSSMQFLIPAVPGQMDALMHAELTDTSPSGVINRIRLALAPRDQSYTAVSDFTAWHNPAPAAGTSLVTGYTDALNSDYIARTIFAGMAYADLGTVTLPATQPHRGTRDGYLRAWATGTPIGTPGSFSVTKADAIVTSQATTNDAATTPAVPGAQASSSISGNGSGTLSRAGCVSGSTQLFLAAINANAGSATISATGTTFVKIVDQVDSGNAQHLYGWLVRGGGTSTVTITVSATTGTPVTTIGYIELLNLGSNPVLADIADVTGGANNPSLSVTTGNTADQVVALIGTGATPGVGTPGTVIGYAGEVAALGLGAWHQVTGKQQSASVKVMLAGGQWLGYMVALSVPTTTTSTNVNETYSEPTPGNLDIGTYTLRVRAIDATAARGNATASAAVTTTVKRSSVTGTWSGVSQARGYEVTIQVAISGQPVRFYQDITQNIFYTLTDLAGLADATALPPTNGAVAPAPFLRTQIGTAGDSVMSDVPYDVQTDGSGNFMLYRGFAHRSVPPVAAMLDDWINGKVNVQGKSANGMPASFGFDALWCVPSFEPQATIWVPELGLTSHGTFVIETHRSGNGCIGWLLDAVSGVEVGRLLATGAPRFAPGDNILTVNVEQAGGVHAMSASFTLRLTFHPRISLSDSGGA